ncbi:MAG: hypothetical protein AAF267_09950 [Deinococcota bacterium]
MEDGKVGFIQVLDGDAVLEQVIGPEGGNILGVLHEYTLDGFFPYGIASVLFFENVLNDENNIKFTISETNTTQYPNIPGIEAYYPFDKVNYIGPLVTVEFPTSTITLDSNQDKPLFVINSSFEENIFDSLPTRDTRLEVRIHLADGNIVMYTWHFGYMGEVIITDDFLEVHYEEQTPEVLKISVQAVDISQALPNPDDFLPPSEGGD